MDKAPRPVNETQRLETLHALDLLDTAPEQGFDDLVALARQLAGAPAAVVSLVDEERQWVKASVGLEVCATAREIAFCGHAILTPDQVTWVADAREDPRFAANPRVTGEPFVRFYAGAQLVVHGAGGGAQGVPSPEWKGEGQGSGEEPGSAAVKDSSA